MLTLEEISKLGKVEKEIEPIAGVKVKMHSLTVAEEQKVNESLAAFPTDIMSRAKPMQIETLVYAIDMINDKNFSDPKELRTYLNGLQGFILDLFYNSYISLEKEATESITSLKK